MMITHSGGLYSHPQHHFLTQHSSSHQKSNVEIGWELKINVCEFDLIEQSLTVTGEMHIGGVIFHLVEQLGSNIRNDWSDFALWWPEKNMWLNKTKYTLDQYGVQADANLYFTRMHKPLRIQMPDQQYLEVNADFSINVFNTVKQICKELGIRHHEEVSLLKVNLANDNSSNKKNKEKQNKIKQKLNDNIKIQQSKSSFLNTSISSSTNQSSLKDNSMIISLHSNGKENANGSISSTSATSTLNNSSSNNSSADASSKLMRHRSQSLSIENGNGSWFGNSCVIINDSQSLALSPIISTQDYISKNEIKYKSLLDKAKLNAKWLDSSKSLMEQNIKENDLVQLRFKYYAFFDLNIKYDLNRLNQIYEQAKWSILSEEIDCTETELIQFAALQLQIQIQTKQYLNSSNGQNSVSKFDLLTLDRSITLNSNSKLLNRTNSHFSNDVEKYYKNGNSYTNSCNVIAIQDEDDVDTALSKLEKSLDIVDNNSQNGEIIKFKKRDNLISNKNDNDDNCDIIKHDSTIELCEELFLMKNQKYTIKKFKSYYFILNDIHYLSYYKSKEDSSNGRPIDKINLRGCELVPDVNVSSRKLGIIVKVPSSEGMSEFMIRCPNEESYASWMSACKLASKNRSIADPNYLNEVKSILNLLQMQQNNVKNGKSSLTMMRSKSGSITNSYFSIADSAEAQPNNLLPARILKKHKLKQLNDRILEEYSTISDLDMFEAKWRYIKEWQGLPNYGMTYFIIKVKGSRFKEEILCLTSNRIIRMSPEGEQIKSWRYNTMKSWNVNWEIKQFEIIFEEELLVFLCSNCDPKILHEFIGSYIFLSLRIRDKPETFSEEMFFKLTEKR